MQDNFKLVASGLNVKPLQEYLEANPELWSLLTVRQDLMSIHKDTETIFVRGPVEMTVDNYFNTDSAVDYPIPMDLAALLAPLLLKVDQEIKPTKLGRMLLVKLNPDGHVLSHVDTGTYAKAYSRFHLVVSTSGGNSMVCNGEKQHMRAGEVWWFNHRKEHSATNDSSEGRVHFIFDLATPLFEVDQESL